MKGTGEEEEREGRLEQLEHCQPHTESKQASHLPQSMYCLLPRMTVSPTQTPEMGL